MASSLYNKISRIQQLKNTYITTSNLKQGTNVFGVNGTYTNDATAYGSDMVSGKTAYARGTKIVGGLTEYTNLTRNIPWGSIRDDYDNQCLRINYSNTTNTNTRPNYHTNCGDAVLRNGSYIEIPYTNLAKTIGLDALTLKKDTTVLGVTGQYDASTEFSGIKMDPIIESNTAISLTSSITEVSGLDMTQGTNLAYYFSALYGLRSITNISAPNVQNLHSFCNGDNKLQKFEYVNFYNEEQAGVNCGYMFNNCVNLRALDETVRLPKVINYCWYMFDNCRNLAYINTPLNISYPNIERLFYNCTNLRTVSNLTIPANTYQYSRAFYNCRELDIANLDLKGLNLNRNTANMFYDTQYSTWANLKKMMNTVSYYLIANTGLGGTAIEYVDDNIFNEIPQLSRGNQSTAFQYCRNLQYVDFHSISSSSMLGAFWGCSNLRTVNISSPNISFGGMSNTFMYCYNLTDVNFGLDNKLTSLTNTFRECNNLVNINFNNSFSQTVNTTLVYTFYNCQNISSFKANITTGVTQLNGAFYNCYNLKEVFFNSREPWYTKTEYLASAFYNCSNLTTIDNQRDLVFNVISPATLTQAFINCRNLNVNSISINGNASGEIGSFTNFLTNNPYLTSVNLNINGNIANSYYGTNITDVFANCPNVKYANIKLSDNSVHTNTWNIGSIVSHASNLQEANLDIWCNANRHISGYPIMASNVDNYNYNITRNLSRNIATNIFVYGGIINNFNGKIDAATGSIQVSYGNIKNFNVSLVNVTNLAYFSISESNWGSNYINVNFPNVDTCTTFQISNTQNFTDLNVNLPNVGTNTSKNIGMRLNINYCKDLINANINLCNITNLYSLNFRECTKFQNLNLNVRNVEYIDYTYSFYNMPNITTINTYMPNLVKMNYSFGIQNCNVLTTVNLGFGAKLTNLYEIQFNNLPNLTTVEMDYPNIKNVYVTGYVIFNRCPNLTDQTIDNLFGMLSKLDRIGTKFINYSFRNCNLSQARAQNLANYNNLISAGWTY